jgi:hypothetical protein
VTVVDLVQLGVLALLLGPDFNDMRSGSGTDLLPLGIGTGACKGATVYTGSHTRTVRRRSEGEDHCDP